MPQFKRHVRLVRINRPMTSALQRANSVPRDLHSQNRRPNWEILMRSPFPTPFGSCLELFQYFLVDAKFIENGVVTVVIDDRDELHFDYLKRDGRTILIKIDGTVIELYQVDWAGRNVTLTLIEKIQEISFGDIVYTLTFLENSATKRNDSGRPKYLQIIREYVIKKN